MYYTPKLHNFFLLPPTYRLFLCTSVKKHSAQLISSLRGTYIICLFYYLHHNNACHAPFVHNHKIRPALLFTDAECYLCKTLT